MSLLYKLLEISYDVRTKMYFFISPFAFMALGWVLVYFEIYILKFDAQQAASITFFPIIIYFIAWVLFMVFVRMKYYTQDGELKKIEYIK